MKNLSPTITGILHILGFTTGYLVTQTIFAHSDSREAYALLNAWWLSMYLGLVTGTKLRSLNVAFPLALAGLTMLYSLGLGDTFYHDAPEWLSLELALVVLMQSLVVVSPILINSGLALILKR